jgi:hypothetical protein
MTRAKILLSLFAAFAAFTAPAQQLRTIRATNCNCSITTYTNANSMDWNGTCTNGWCDGYGTVHYYDPNGYYLGAYVGNVLQGYLTGFGTKYYSDGSLFYRGQFKGNAFVNLLPFYLVTDDIGNFVVDSLLSGGIHRHCEIVKGVFSSEGDFQEIRFRVTCDGQIINDNHYDCTLVIYNKAPWVDMVNVNDNAAPWILANLARYITQIYNWMRTQPRNTQQ